MIRPRLLLASTAAALALAPACTPQPKALTADDIRQALLDTTTAAGSTSLASVTWSHEVDKPTRTSLRLHVAKDGQLNAWTHSVGFSGKAESRRGGEEITPVPADVLVGADKVDVSFLHAKLVELAPTCPGKEASAAVTMLPGALEYSVYCSQPGAPAVPRAWIEGQPVDVPKLGSAEGFARVVEVARKYTGDRPLGAMTLSTPSAGGVPVSWMERGVRTDVAGKPCAASYTWEAEPTAGAPLTVICSTEALAPVNGALTDLNPAGMAQAWGSPTGEQELQLAPQTGGLAWKRTVDQGKPEYFRMDGSRLG